MAEQQMMVPLETYLKSGLHIGTKYRTKYMEPFIYKVRPDGLAVLNIQVINQRLQQITQFLSRFAPEEILIVGKRENASWTFAYASSAEHFPIARSHSHGDNAGHCPEQRLAHDAVFARS